MQNYRDNSLAGLASYRERVVQVRLKSDEGSFNLAMNKKVIEGVVKKGQMAGAKLNEQFNMLHHQWARLRVLISELDEKFRKIRADGRDGEFEALIQAQRTDGQYPFREPDEEWVREVTNRVRALRDTMDLWVASKKSVYVKAGSPSPVLRVTPNV
jgi:hypothetical protein